MSCHSVTRVYAHDYKVGLTPSIRHRCTAAAPWCVGFVCPRLSLALTKCQIFPEEGEGFFDDEDSLFRLDDTNKYPGSCLDLVEWNHTLLYLFIYLSPLTEYGLDSLCVKLLRKCKIIWLLLKVIFV